MEEIKEPTKNKCQYCGKDYQNVSVHERFCKKNLLLNRGKPNKDAILTPEKEQPKDPQQEQKPLIITDVQQVAVDESDDFPWFDDADGNRKPEVYNFIGIHDNIPCVLVMHYSGRLIPCYLIQGFIGMFPKYHEFPEVQQELQKKQEIQHIAPEEDKPPKPLIEPIISPLQEEKFGQVITPEQIHAQTEKKQSLLGRILGKKEKATAETTNSTADLAKRIIDAQTS